MIRSALRWLGLIAPASTPDTEPEVADPWTDYPAVRNQHGRVKPQTHEDQAERGEL